MKWSLCHSASFARSIQRQGTCGGRTLWMMETSLGHPYTWIPGITTHPPAPISPHVTGGRDSAIFLVWRKIHYHQPCWLSGLCLAQGTHIYLTQPCTVWLHDCWRRKKSTIVCFGLHVYVYTHISLAFVCVSPFYYHQIHSLLWEMSSLVQMIWLTWHEAFCRAFAMMTSSNTEEVFKRREKRGAFKLFIHNAIDVLVSGW